MSKIVLGVHFGTFQSQYQIVSSKDNFLQKHRHPFRGGTVLFNPNQTVGSVMRSKRLTYTKIPQKPENLLKGFRVYSLELLVANTRSFQVKKFFSKKLATLLEEAQFI